MLQCPTRVSRLWQLALSCGTACLVNTACDELPAIPGGICGNRVIDEGEQCDDDLPSDTCHAPETEHECLIDCRAAPCSDGAGCGLDGVCRVASGQMSSFVFRPDYPGAPLMSGDFDGDGRKDLLVLDIDRALLSFDEQRRLRFMSASGLPFGMMTVSRIDGDDIDGVGRDDVVAFSSDELSLLHGSPVGLLPLPQLRAAPAAESRRILSLDLDGDGGLDPLLLADRGLFRVSAYDVNEFGALGTLEVSAADLAGPIRRLSLPGSPNCRGFVLASGGAPSVHVYEVCAEQSQEFPTPISPARLVSTVALPPPALVGPAGVSVGDADGDGIDDLLIAGGTALDSIGGEGELVYVAYGLGNGSFQSQPRGTAQANATGVAHEEPIELSGRLLDVAHLDGDAFVDFVTTYTITLGPGSAAGCNSGGPCELWHGEDWVAAAAADFTRDGNVDLIGVSSGARSLTLFLGAGGARFNRHVIRAGSLVDAPQLLGGRSPILDVGDYDGDLTTDLAFTLLDVTAASPARTAAILYGQALSIPSEIQTVGSVGDVEELVTTGAFGAGSPSTANGLLFRARSDNTDGIGLLVGQTTSGGGPSSSSAVGSGDLTRVLTSPLRFPNLGADQNSFTSITALALGAFTGHADRQEAVALAVTARGIEDLDEEGTQLWLTFIENRGAGLAIVDPRQAPFEFPPELSWSLEQSWAEFSTPVMQALDLDADGVDELVVCSSQVVQGELAYWVIRRQGGAWSSEQHQVAVAGASDLAIRASSYGDGADEPLSGPVDVDSDGKLDLMARGGGDAGPFVVVLRNGGSGTLAGGTALALDPTVQAAAFANVDGDRALELVAVGERGVQFYDVDLLSGALEERTTDIPSGAVSRLTVGDFDGDGITDIATAGEAVTVYFGDPESR